jgi:acyl carrier protein
METDSADRVLALAQEVDPAATSETALRDVFSDSLDFLDFIRQAENLAGATLSDEELQGMETVRGLANALRATVQVEAWSDCVEELETLFPAHWKELARFQEQIALRCDRDRYAALEKAGALLLITARMSQKLIGYFVAFLFPHPHYFGSGLWGMTDMYFVLPEFRNGVGVRLFVAFERELRARGCVQAVTSCKLHEDHTELLTKLGWTWTDKTFQKHLKG